MIKEIITDYDALSERSDEINTRKEGDAFRAIVLDLKDTLIDKNIPALSAIQIGIPKRVFTINFNKRRKAFVNPFITNCEQFTFSRETSPCYLEENLLCQDMVRFKQHIRIHLVKFKQLILLELLLLYFSKWLIH